MGKPPVDRPDFFNREALEAWLEQQYPSAGVSEVMTELYLLVPLLIRNIGNDGFLKALTGYEEEFGLRPSRLEKESVGYIRQWATELLESYREIRERKRHQGEAAR